MIDPYIVFDFTDKILSFLLNIYMSWNIDEAILVLIFSHFLFSLHHATTSWRVQNRKFAQKEESLSQTWGDFNGAWVWGFLFVWFGLVVLFFLKGMQQQPFFFRKYTRATSSLVL